MSIAASERRLLSSGHDAELPSSVVFAHAESDSELTAMFARTAACIRLFLRDRIEVRHLKAPCPTPMPFFPEVHEKLWQYEGKFVPKSASKVFPLSLSSTVGKCGGLRGFPRWSAQFLCIYAGKVLPRGGVIRNSRLAPVR